jgi:hypothetical protein
VLLLLLRQRLWDPHSLGLTYVVTITGTSNGTGNTTTSACLDARVRVFSIIRVFGEGLDDRRIWCQREV